MTIQVILIPSTDSRDLEEHEISRKTEDGDIESHIKALLDETDFLETVLLRPRQNYGAPGLYAYHNNPLPSTTPGRENIRATRLAMACGLLSLRFFGNVLLMRADRVGGSFVDLTIEEIEGAACISPDLRESLQEEATNTIRPNRSPTIPSWLAEAAHQNYHDSAALALVAKAMDMEPVESNEIDGIRHTSEAESKDREQSSEFIAKNPLCLHCRALTSSLCPDCCGGYFCIAPKSCRKRGWSHSCLCKTWKIYTSHRKNLSYFAFFGDWQKALVGRDFQMSEEPYRVFLQSLGIDMGCTSWWRTETDGWAGGCSDSAQTIDIFLRKTYQQGFYPIQEIPPERLVLSEDVEGLDLERNNVGLISLSSWKEYYKLRGIPESSPVALLCTFPLTVYYAIEKFGEVPITVSRMLKRQLRVHVVGAEKEINFLDLFKEVSFLLPNDLEVELVFIVRQDMLPAKYKSSTSSLKLTLTQNLTLHVISGTYGDSLDPRFDCGTGGPDMILALNAGLYAYESWRSVVNYLYANTGVVGVFTDYNEYSGVNCAAIGGEQSRNSLAMNPFRQPLAMPVYSMNLPQFSNGWIYAFNQQELD